MNELVITMTPMMMPMMPPASMPTSMDESEATRDRVDSKGSITNGQTQKSASSGDDERHPDSTWAVDRPENEK